MDHASSFVAKGLGVLGRSARRLDARPAKSHESASLPAGSDPPDLGRTNDGRQDGRFVAICFVVPPAMLQVAVA